VLQWVKAGRRFAGILGINIGKNKITPEEQSLDDYLTGLNTVYPYADYITVNIASPNTPGLRNLQFMAIWKSSWRYTRLSLAANSTETQGQESQVPRLYIQIS
jgi:dihydroorotate dehydrogenase